MMCNRVFWQRKLKANAARGGLWLDVPFGASIRPTSLCYTTIRYATLNPFLHYAFIHVSSTQLLHHSLMRHSRFKVRVTASKAQRI